MAQYAFSSQNYPEAQHALAELSTVYFPPPSSRPPPTYHIFPISNQLLYLHFSLLFITYHMHTGNMKAATEKLTEVHQILDQKQDEVTLDELKGYTTVKTIYFIEQLITYNSMIICNLLIVILDTYISCTNDLNDHICECNNSSTKSTGHNPLAIKSRDLYSYIFDIRDM